MRLLAFGSLLCLVVTTIACNDEVIVVRTTAASDASADAADAAGDGGIWQPEPGLSFQYQLSGALDRSWDVDVYIIDLDLADSEFASLRADGRTIACYFSAGSLEAFRAEADTVDVEPAARGDAVPGFDDEVFLDIRAETVRDLMVDRVARALRKGCDAVVPGLVDSYRSATGFDLGPEDQLAFNRFLAAEAHRRGLSVGLLNDLPQVAVLADVFDWGLAFFCHDDGDPDFCDPMRAFIDRNRAVFQVEPLGADRALACAYSARQEFELIFKGARVGAAREVCP